MYCEVVHYLLETYTKDDVIVGTLAKILSFTQPTSRTGIEYIELLCAKAFSCDEEYWDLVLKDNLI